MPKKTTGNLRARPLGRTFLRAWREKLGLKPEDAAEKIGIERTYLGRIESGKQPYSQQILEATAEAYGRQPADLIGLDPANAEIWDLALETAQTLIAKHRASAPFNAPHASAADDLDSATLARAVREASRQRQSRRERADQKSAPRADRQVDQRGGK